MTSIPSLSMSMRNSHGDGTNPTTGGRAPGVPAMRGAAVKTGAPAPQMGGSPSLIPAAGYQATPIDGQNPSLRGKELAFNVPTAQFNPVTMGAAPTLDFGGFSLDPSQFAGAVGGGGGGFAVNNQSVQDQAMKTFHSQLPQMNINFGDEVEQLAKRTSAMGRQGSGLFNRDTDLMSGRQLAAREALLGNIGLQAATTDAGNNLQAQIATGQFDSQAKQRGLQGQMANASNSLQAAMQNASMNQAGQMFDVGNQMSVDQFNAGMLNDAGLWNAQNQQNMGMAGLNHALGERGYQDQLAGQAQNDLMNQLGFMGQGFNGNPADYSLGAAGAFGNMAGMFGSNAAQTSAGMGGMGAALAQLLAGQGGGGGGGGGGIMDILGGLFGGGGQASPADSMVASAGASTFMPSMAY